MSRNDPTEVLVAVHFDAPGKHAVLVSIDGDNTRAKWIPRAHLKSYHLTGKTTKGTDSGGQVVILPLAHMTVPEWLAQREGMI